MKQIANALSGTRTEGSTSYMNNDVNSYSCPLQHPEDCRDLNKLKEIYTQRALKYVIIVQVYADCNSVKAEFLKWIILTDPS